MNLQKFLQQEILLPRLKLDGVLVVYDPVGRYRTLCLELKSLKLAVIDASMSSITSRAEALAALQRLSQANTGLEGLLVYIPAKAPITDEEKQRDPFAIYGGVGQVFPNSDGDEYLSLCLKFKPDHATTIRRIFNTDPNPSFAAIDAVGGGAGWPALQALLNVESARELLFALLAPTPVQFDALKSTENWIPEATTLFISALGMSLKTRIRTWTAISDELWRFLLFSEFAFDLPGELPAALTDVPRAGAEAQPSVFDLCERLRSDRRTQGTYIERAEAIQKDMNLPGICAAVHDFGLRDTFPFEERACFNQAVKALKGDNIDTLRLILERHSNSIWVEKGENQSQWDLLRSAAGLVQACEDAERQLPEHIRSLETLTDFYISSLRDADRLQREFEQAVGDSVEVMGSLGEVKDQARKTYRRLADRVQDVFIKHVERSGWPINGWMSNADMFDKLVAPKLLESGKRVALLMIDAVRYELGVELAKQLDGEGQVEVQAACAQLPSVTEVGMASLLPGAGQSLKLIRKDDRMVPALGDQTISNVTQRMDVLRSRYGQRFAEVTLTDFVRGVVAIPKSVELLIIRSNEMDNDFESNPETAPGLISRTFQRIRSALHLLRDQGFQDAVIATDHGFFLNTALEPGDACTKAPGSWTTVHDRMLLGDGSQNLANLVLPASNLGIRGDFNQVAAPRSVVAYRAGQTYFHGGLSLQEAIVPIIAVHIRAAQPKTSRTLSVELTYKRGAKRITTQLPVIIVSVIGQGDLFTSTNSVDMLIEAQNIHGNVVGEAKPGGSVNPATRLVSLHPGESTQVTIKMDPAYEGAFTIKALDPNTLTALGKPLELETDYMV